MPDYKEMYLKLFRATETAISCLIAAQQECEELYINSPEPDIILLTKPKRDIETDENENHQARL